MLLQGCEQKQQEILNAAKDLFLNEGYEATSMGKIAKRAGVAPNTIYWYFKDKDELLITILNSELMQGIAQYMGLQDQEITGRLLWVIDQLKMAKQLVSTVHARLHLSPDITLWHQQFHLLVENVLREEYLKKNIPEHQIEAKVKIAVFTVEGLLSHVHTQQEKESICHALFDLP